MSFRLMTFAAVLALAPVTFAASTSQSLTLEQIMADADWLGNQPEGAFWGSDSRTVYFQQKRQGSKLRDFYSVDSDDGTTTRIDERDWSATQQSSIAYNLPGNRRAWVYAGDIYMSEDTGVRQVTRTSAVESAPMFMTDGERLAFQRDSQWFVFDPASGLVAQLTDIRFAEDPTEDGEFDVMRDHQRRLYDKVRQARDDKLEAREREMSIYRVDPGRGPAPIYMGDKLESEGLSLSPDGQSAILVTRAKDFDAGKKDAMPNYVSDSGYIETQELRTRVGRNAPAPHSAWLIDLETGEKLELDVSGLPGIKDDPLADLRASAIEHFVAAGEARADAEKRLAAPEVRAVAVWQTKWSPDGRHAALYIRTRDNKDRWLATVDVSEKKLVNQHRLSDEAWVNARQIEYGWLRDNRTLWFQSEDHGYLGIYLKRLDKRRSTPLVAGRHVVFDPVLGPQGKYLYYKANVSHPGIYEIWRVDVGTSKAEQLTSLGGVNDVSVSPDSTRLLVTHSETNRHPELFVQENRPGAEARRLTDTMGPDYKAIDWIEPEIVPVPSSHSDKPIYSKVYLPAGHDPAKSYPAVMFVHGAGYTQNAHLGWPYYFREGMFHNLLTQHGYVVIDMDYRASQGYGRDWRTAIYRRMGTPELEDFHDGVDYIVEHYGVDRERVGIYGGSYGGFMTFMAMFRSPGTFKAGAALRPVSDWSHYNHGYTSNILNTPDIDPEAYRRSSPIEFADGLQDPLLIASGMQDDNVFFQDAVLIVQRLIELKKEDFEIAIYPLDPHGFVHAESWLDEYRRIFRLFEENLK